MTVTLINCPYFRNVIFDLFETLVVFEKSICFVGIVNVRIVFPFDMESLEDDNQEVSRQWVNATYKIGLRDILGIILVVFISPMKHDLINLVSWLGYTKNKSASITWHNHLKHTFRRSTGSIVITSI